MSHLRRFFRDTHAATAVEYCVMLALILLVVFASVGVVGVRTGGLWSNAATSIGATGR